MPRLASIAIAVLVLVAGLALAAVGLRLTDTWAIGGYLLALAALGLGWGRLMAAMPTLASSLARERTVLLNGFVLCAAVYPFYVNDPYQMHVMAFAGIYALMALGLNVTTGFAGLADFGYIAYYAIGAYASALFNLSLGLDFWICLPLAALVTAGLSMLVALPAVRVTGHYLALVTLGFSFIVIQLITNLEWLTNGTQGLAGMEPPSLFGHSFQQPLDVFGFTLPFQANFYYLMLVLLCLAVVVCGRLSRSRWGRAWGAMRGNETAASATGLNLTRLKLLAFGTGSCFGGIAGSVYAHMVGYIDPSTFRVIESVFLLAIVAIGNWRIGGVIAAAVLFTVLPEKMRAFDEWRLLIFGAVLLIVMLARGRRMIGSNY
ncbi:high-affinity branched-chain amino acid ABC transporter permease LivM [Verticiella sediminum]